jgi:hypothetical protein
MAEEERPVIAFLGPEASYTHQVRFSSILSNISAMSISVCLRQPEREGVVVVCTFILLVNFDIQFISQASPYISALSGLKLTLPRRLSMHSRKNKSHFPLKPPSQTSSPPCKMAPPTAA